MNAFCHIELWFVLCSVANTQFKTLIVAASYDSLIMVLFLCHRSRLWYVFTQVTLFWPKHNYSIFNLTHSDSLANKWPASKWRKHNPKDLVSCHDIPFKHQRYVRVVAVQGLPNWVPRHASVPRKKVKFAALSFILWCFDRQFMKCLVCVASYIY